MCLILQGYFMERWQAKRLDIRLDALEMDSALQIEAVRVWQRVESDT